MDRWEGRSLSRGGKARRVGGHPALARQKAIAEHDQRQMSMQPIPAPPLVMIQAAFALGVLIKLLNGPAAVGQLDQALQGGIRWQVAEVPLAVTTFARYGTLAKQPALR